MMDSEFKLYSVFHRFLQIKFAYGDLILRPQKRHIWLKNNHLLLKIVYSNMENIQS